MKTSHSISVLLLIAAAICLAGCGEEKKKRGFTFFGNMHDQNSVRAQESEPLPETKSGNVEYVRAMRKPVDGTIPTHFVPYDLKKDTSDFNIGKGVKNPLPMTEEVLKAGRRAYNIYCIVCHGERGMGNGTVTASDVEGYLKSGHKAKGDYNAMPSIPVAYTGRDDGQIYHLISKGGDRMPSYGRLPASMRWAIVHYIKVLKKANSPSESDLKSYLQAQEQYADKDPSHIVNQWKESLPQAKSETKDNHAGSKSH